MSDNKNSHPEKAKTFIHLGSFDFSGKGPGTYSGGVVKLYSNPRKDLLDSAESFLKAADRCLNGCKVEVGMEMLTVPGAVCASFACELYLKYILLVENGEAARGHRLADLFRKCSKEIQSAVAALRADIVDILQRNTSQFVEIRYHHERECISFCQQELLQVAELLSRFVTDRYSQGR
jgi:HEPN domain-containing protein